MCFGINRLDIPSNPSIKLNGAVVESVYTADLKSAAIKVCGFEPRPRYQIGEKKMSVMNADGKILQPGGGWWSPYGNTDKEIRENMKTGHMPNAPDAMRVGPSRYFTGTKTGDEQLSDFLGDIGALGGQAKEAYENRKKKP